MSAAIWSPSEVRDSSQYETPQVIELGGVVALTNGNGADDTADMNQYYY